MSKYAYNGPQNPDTELADDLDASTNWQRNTSENPATMNNKVDVDLDSDGITKRNGAATDYDEPTDPQKVTDILDTDITGKGRNISGCGYGSCRPKTIQSWNNPKSILAVLCWFVIVQGFAVNGVNNVNTSTIERRFKLPSWKVGFISSAYDISAGLTVIIISYYARFGHMPRWLGLAALSMAFGSVTMVIPHFASGQYELGLPVSDKCPATASTCNAANEDNSLQNFLFVLILGQLLHGLGGTTLYTVGVVYIDDNVHADSSPLYISIFEGMAALGPAIGYIAGGAFLDIYVDIDAVDTSAIHVEPNDPRWVGAWWIGFVISACLFVSVSLFLFCFGRESPIAEEVRSQRVSQAFKGSEDQLNKSGFGKSIRDLPKITFLLIKNPTFMMLTLAGAAQLFLAAGFATFIAKYIQNQLYQTPSWSAMLSGFVIVPSAAGGQVIGGVIANRLKLKVPGLIRLCVISQVIACVAMGAFFVTCSPPDMAGINRQYTNTSIVIGNKVDINLTSSCNSGCGCSLESREPVCGINNVEYFSPCHAGCLSYNKTTGAKTTYGNCSCIAAQLPSGNYDFSNMATGGQCDNGCTTLPVFLAVLFVLIGCSMLPLVPSLSATLRCIPTSTRTFALGIQWVFLRFLGSIPGPIVFGALMDNACSVWQSKCAEKGACWLYDTLQMSLTIFGLGLALGLLTLFFFVVALLVYKPPICSSDSQDALGESVTEVSTVSKDVGIADEDDMKKEQVSKF
ncbi:solute carrier organic anion transporter family member 4A1-like [Tubulanus polymorphus]|uniref:solute carrier organic anion transporter family member 4A1-like n=1 Tax=Tubulanus polymorphus TaxID=672921 RepID=UPI003DA65A55